MKMKGTRKLNSTTLAQMVLLIGLIASIYLKASDSLFTTFAAAIVGTLGSFMWGNSKEHQAQNQTTVITQPTTK